MAARLIDGKAIAAAIRRRLEADVARLAPRAQPTLAALLIGDDPAARAYAESQQRAAAALAIGYRLVPLPASTTQVEATAALDRLNADPAVHGIIVQAPLPAGLDLAALQSRVSRIKDVEGCNPENLGRLWIGQEALVPCTALAAFECVRHTGIELAGCHAVVIGRSAIVGKPVAALLLAAHSTVTQCHSRTPDLAEQARRAAVLIVAAGKAGLVGGAAIRPGAVVVDVGMNRVVGADGASRMVGDVKFDEAESIAGWLTPVPGGVGPVTAAMLMANVIAATTRQLG